MKRALFAVLLLLAAGSCARQDFAYADGSAGRYSDWRGRWVFINYWAEWCAPCRYEIPELNAIRQTLGEKALVVGVNFDGVAGAPLRALIERMKIEFPVMTTDPRMHFGYELPGVLPSTIVIDPDGSVAATLVGPQTESTLRAAMGNE